MQYRNDLYDYKVFLKKNYKLILFTTLIIIIGLFGAAFLLRGEDTELSEDEVAEERDQQQEEILSALQSEEIEIYQLDSDEQAELKEYLHREAFYFRTVIENEDYSVFDDTVLLREIFFDEDILNAIQESTSINFTLPPEIFMNISTLNNSSVIEFSFGTGNDTSDRTLANFYYNYLQNGDIPVLENKRITFLDSSPEKHEIKEVPEEIIELASQEEAPDRGSQILEIVLIVAVIGLLIGLAIGIFAALIKEMFGKTIPSMYNFSQSNVMGDVVRLDAIPEQNQETYEKLTLQTIFSNTSSSKLVLNEFDFMPSISSKLDKYTSDATSQELFYANEIEEVPLEKRFDEVIIFVEMYTTTKDWYEKISEQVKSLKVPVKVIRLPGGLLSRE